MNRAILVTLFAFALSTPTLAAEPKPEDLEFFEKKVRPVLATRCFKCHGPKQQKAGLRLDSRTGMLNGGDSGPAIVPGKPEQGYLIDAINYGDLYQMPPDGKLKKDQIEAITRWVRLGAPWPGGGGTAVAAKKEFNLKERAKHWSFQPIRAHAPPAVEQTDWPRSDADRFVLAKLEAAGLRPVPEADRRTWIRRVYFALIGLPPEPDAVEAFVHDKSPRAFETVVDGLLQSPHFGERWARHWLDLVRYAESRGHEFDYDAPNAWQYRDYVIRAFNADVPYDQFVTEHLAGDLLEEPRRHPREGFNESILGTGSWFLGEWVHSPVDVRLDEAERFDNMIDVMSKTFLGLTVACARCHDHKFDAIPQSDYYALYGFLQSSSYRQARFDSLDHNRRLARQLDQLRREARERIAEAVVAAQQPVLTQLSEYLLAAREAILLGPQVNRKPAEVVFEDFEAGNYQGWTLTGTAFGPAPVTLKTIAKYQGRINGVGKFFVNSHNVRPGKGPRSDAHTGTLTSRKFRIEHNEITFLVGGGSHAGKTCVNLLVDGKAVLSATGRNNNQMFPHRWDVRRFKGKEAQIQVVDNHTGGWGNIGLDHIVFTNATGKGGSLDVEQLAPAYRQQISEIGRKHDIQADVLVRFVVHLINVRNTPNDPLHLWSVVSHDKKVKPDDSASVEAAIAPVLKRYKERMARAKAALKDVEVIVDYSRPPERGFGQDGFTFGSGPVRPGDVLLGDDPARPLVGVAIHGYVRRDPAFAGLKLAGGTQRDPGRLGGWVRAGQTFRTPTFTISAPRLYYLARGTGRSYVTVDSHRVNQGPLHGQFLGKCQTSPTDKPRWFSHDLSMYRGHRAHMEFSAEGDDPLEVFLVVQSSRPPGDPLDLPDLMLEQLLGVRPGEHSLDRLADDCYQRTLLGSAALLGRELLGGDRQRAHRPWADWLLRHPELVMSDGQAARAKITDVARAYLDKGKRLAEQIRRESRTAPAMWDGQAEDERLFIRGNHKTLGEVVPRRFLAALEAKPIRDPGSGRLQLARQMTDPTHNPFITRVFVNRVWHHLFGRGIVASVDNFGVLGKPPTHPELLDHLASRFVQDGWSLKRLIRSIVLGSTYRMSSDTGGRGDEIDPENLLLHRMPVRRLEAEAIRDSILAVSGRLDRRQFGPPVPVYLTPFMQGRGRPGRSGPLDGAGRRSIYIAIRRNFLSPMMLAFDTPIPFTTMGRRNVSNVPAQALILMNDPFVIGQAGVWARRVLSEPHRTPRERIAALYRSAFARPPREQELTEALAFLHGQAAEHGLRGEQAFADPRVWTDLCHVLMNVKEFVFVH